MIADPAVPHPMGEPSDQLAEQETTPLESREALIPTQPQAEQEELVRSSKQAKPSISIETDNLINNNDATTTTHRIIKLTAQEQRPSDAEQSSNTEFDTDGFGFGMSCTHIQ